MTGERQLQMVRGNEALTLPQPVIDLARSVDRAVAGDPLAGRVLAEKELAILRAIELATGRRVHKGHALHNIGVGVVAEDHLRARVYFHAAHAEDVRTFPDELPSGWGIARDVLVHLYQERQSAIRALADAARETVSDPFELAREFEAEQGADLGVYVGLRSSWRTESDLDDLDRSDLVFVAGTHAFPHHMKALRDAVTDVGLIPVIVMEFPNLPDDNDYRKSERFMRRSGWAMFDLSFLQGQMFELPMAASLGVPFFAGYIGGSVDAPLHGTGMVPGFLTGVGVTPEAVVDCDQLREAARAWLRSTPNVHSIKYGGLAGGLPIESAAGSASPFIVAESSNSHYLPDAPFVVPSGEGYFSTTDDAMESARYWADRLIGKEETETPEASDLPPTNPRGDQDPQDL